MFYLGGNLMSNLIKLKKKQVKGELTKLSKDKRLKKPKLKDFKFG
tara:strand:+ start:10944 stop:11078 length:135 start_codon:yes stop_codon:yes gene_type:complete